MKTPNTVYANRINEAWAIIPTALIIIVLILMIGFVTNRLQDAKAPKEDIGDVRIIKIN